MVSNSKEKWLPIPVSDLKAFLIETLPWERGPVSGYIVHKNVAYNLQYCQYIRSEIEREFLTGVLQALHIRSYLLHGMAVVEGTIEYILRAECGYNNKQLHASDISKEWRKRSSLEIDNLLDSFQKLVPARNRVHLTKNEDDPNSLLRDTAFNYFSETIKVKVDKLLFTYLSSRLFDRASRREEVLSAFKI